MWLEIALSVADDFGGDFDDAAAYVPCEQWFRSALKGDLKDVGTSPRRSRLFEMVPGSARFVEFDSGNVTHAGAIYEAAFEGPDDLVNKLEGGNE
jgi:hypothetical protein